MNRIDQAVRVIEAEAEGLRALADSLRADGTAFSNAVDVLMNVRGHLIVVGVGKSGHIGQKLAASFASTGTPAFFMHPTEASHGDLGMVTKDCAVLALSNSGESRELVDVLHFCRKADVPVIGLTRNPASTLGRLSDVVLRLPDTAEACPNGLAPTTSTTNTLALGDALVVAVMNEKGVSEADFGARHPGGKLGRRLQTVADWLELNPHDAPIVGADASVQDVVVGVTEGQAGCVAVVKASGAMVGMITDGDLRRALGPDMFDRIAADIMTADPLTLSLDAAMSWVADELTRRRIGNAFIVGAGKPVGVIGLKQLVAQGYV